jgi:hypothetical protein
VDESFGWRHERHFTWNQTKVVRAEGLEPSRAVKLCGF